jgi:dTDP-glucose 4,6-dehydratase
MSKKIVITGGAGFVGAHLIEHVLKNTTWDIISIDRLDTSGNPNRLTDMDCWETEKHRVKFLFWDLKAEFNEWLVKSIGDFDYFCHLAAGSHVDRSIIDPMSFVMDNVVGTANCLEFFRKYCQDPDKGLPKFLYFSTDEVFGPAPEGVAFKEFDRFNPNNPYAATKAGAELLCDSYANTYRLPIIVTHCMNIFGERQTPEKFVPMLINKIQAGETVSIHSDATKTIAGTRHYLHTRNICSAVLFILEHGKTLNGKGDNDTGEGKYNIVGEVETSNLEMAKLIADCLGTELIYEMVDFHSSRPGHDLRYALNGDKLKAAGFEYPVTFEDSLRKTVGWTLEHSKWLL